MGTEFPKFAMILDTLSYGNYVAESGIRSTVANCLDDTGTLQSIAIDRHRVEGARNDGSTYYNTTAGGALLHPHKVVDGVSIAIAYEDWVAGTAFAAGSYCNNGGKYYSTVAGGTDSATFGDTITWIEQGLYNRRYGLMVEDAVQNKCTNYNANPDAGLTNLVLTDTGTGATLTRVSDTAALASAGLDSICTDGNVYKLTGGTAVAHAAVGGLTGNTNDHTITAWARSADGAAASTYLRDSSNTLSVAFTNTAYARVSGTFTPPDGNRTVSMTVAAGKTLYFILNQLEESPIVSSEIVTAGSAASRATEMGNIKWDSTNLPTGGDLTYVMGLTPDFASGTGILSSATIASFTNGTGFNLLYHGASGSTRVQSYDGSTVAFTDMPAWDKNDTIYLAVTASVQTNTMALHYRNVSKGHAWTHVASVAYDGQFTDTGFLQLFKALGGNNSIVKFLLGYDRTLTDAELEAKF